MYLENFAFGTQIDTTQLLITNRIIPQLANQVDFSPTPQPIITNIQIGLDKAYTSATESLPSATYDCPICKVWTESMPGTNNAQDLTLFNFCNIKLNFIFALASPSSTFSQLRANFFKIVQNALKKNVFADNIGLQYESWWMFANIDKWNLIHDTNMIYMGKTIKLTPESDFSCSVLTIPAQIKYNPTPDELVSAQTPIATLYNNINL